MVRAEPMYPKPCGTWALSIAIEVFSAAAAGCAPLLNPQLATGVITMSSNQGSTTIGAIEPDVAMVADNVSMVI